MNAGRGDALRNRTLGALVISALLILATTLGCQNEQGEPCVEAEDCAKGLACVEERGPKICQRCPETQMCLEEGRCSAVRGHCVAASNEDCRGSHVCERGGACIAYRGRCVEVAGPSHMDDDQEGCPCGCDRSEAMVAVLEVLSPELGQRDAQRSLATIATRERAGYITEAMVQHRLRLLAYLDEPPAEERGPITTAPLTWSGPHPSWRVPAHTTTNGRLSMVTTLLVFGETTERIGDRDKRLRASFRLRLTIDNHTDTTITLEPPTIASEAGLPVSRWYLEGTTGEPWDGALPAGERRTALAIGYLHHALPPGARVDATIALAGLLVDTSTRALGKWDEAAR